MPYLWGSTTPYPSGVYFGPTGPFSTCFYKIHPCFDLFLNFCPLILPHPTLFRPVFEPQPSSVRPTPTAPENQINWHPRIPGGLIRVHEYSFLIIDDTPHPRSIYRI